VDPELVVYGPDGKLETVHYSMLSAMLLNELQKRNSELRNQTANNQPQAHRLKARMFEQAPAAGKNGSRLEAAFNRWNATSREEHQLETLSNYG
jgi:hypothetical protein